MLTWNRRDSTPLSAAPRAPKKARGEIWLKRSERRNNTKTTKMREKVRNKGKKKINSHFLSSNTGVSMRRRRSLMGLFLFLQQCLFRLLFCGLFSFICKRKTHIIKILRYSTVPVIHNSATIKLKYNRNNEIYSFHNHLVILPQSVTGYQLLNEKEERMLYELSETSSRNHGIQQGGYEAS